MQVERPGHAYQLDDGNKTRLVFRHHDDKLDVTIDGCTTCDLLAVLIHRINHLNQGDAYCIENVETLMSLHQAVRAQKDRYMRITAEKRAKVEIPPVPVHRKCAYCDSYLHGGYRECRVCGGVFYG